MDDLVHFLLRNNNNLHHAHFCHQKVSHSKAGAGLYLANVSGTFHSAWHGEGAHRMYAEFLRFKILWARIKVIMS